MSRQLFIAIFIALMMVATAALPATIRILRHPVDSPFAQTVYKYGVRGIGLIMWIVMTIFGTINSDGSMRPWWAILASAYFTFPMFLWGGYLFGRIMAGVLGHRKAH